MKRAVGALIVGFACAVSSTARAADDAKAIQATTDAFAGALESGDYAAASSLLHTQRRQTPEKIAKEERGLVKSYGARSSRKLVKIVQSKDQREWSARYEVTFAQGERAEFVVPVVQEEGAWKVFGYATWPCSIRCFRD